jgi:hypothetical protein
VVLIVVSVALVGAAAFILAPWERSATRPQPVALRPGEQEIAWLYPATSTTTWERLATAVRQANERLQDDFPGLQWQRDPDGATGARSAPEITLTWGDGKSRLVFRWYKLTSQWSPQAWVEALLARRPAPLAVIGGNNSYWAAELARQLAEATTEVPQAYRPLLLLTTATADRVPRPTLERMQGADEENDFLTMTRWSDEARTRELASVYPRRTFRFCFTNRQMTSTVTRFIWSRPELRPDRDPAYLVQWLDDSYSQDLFDGCLSVLDTRATENVLQQWAFVSGSIGLGIHPAMLAGWHTSGFRHDAAVQLSIDSSVGSFASPNNFEANAIIELLKEMHRRTEGSISFRAAQRRPLLILTGQQQPSRRLLRELARSAPDTARRFVVAMGDAVSFNTVYRDGYVTWPIQDIPFRLVFFAHRNPIDSASGFRPLGAGGSGQRNHASGTEDVQLFRDIVEAVALAYRGKGQPVTRADDLAQGLFAIRLKGDHLTLQPEGALLFGPDGRRQDSTGEHIVHLRPVVQGNRVLPRAIIEVWTLTANRVWTMRDAPLSASFAESEVHHGAGSP